MDTRFPRNLAPSEELLAEVRAQKGAQIEMKYEKESDLFYFTPKKREKTSSTTTGLTTGSALFSGNNDPDKKSVWKIEDSQLKPST